MPQKPLNKSAMARWAVANCSKAKPTSGNPNVLPDYYDFSLITDSYDCTNFVSHAVLAGGAPMSYSGSPSSGWYFSGLNYRSYSWSGVVSFYEFLVGNTGTGPFGVDTELCGSGCEIGDIIQFLTDLSGGTQLLLRDLPNRTGLQNVNRSLQDGRHRECLI